MGGCICVSVYVCVYIECVYLYVCECVYVDFSSGRMSIFVLIQTGSTSVVVGTCATRHYANRQWHIYCPLTPLPLFLSYKDCV